MKLEEIGSEVLAAGKLTPGVGSQQCSAHVVLVREVIPALVINDQNLSGLIGPGIFLIQVIA